MGLFRDKINDPYNTVGRSTPQSGSPGKKKWLVQVINADTGEKYVMEPTARTGEDAKKGAHEYLRGEGVPEEKITGRRIKTVSLPLD